MPHNTCVCGVVRARNFKAPDIAGQLGTANCCCSHTPYNLHCLQHRVPWYPSCERLPATRFMITSFTCTTSSAARGAHACARSHALVRAFQQPCNALMVAPAFKALSQHWALLRLQLRPLLDSVFTMVLYAHLQGLGTPSHRRMGPVSLPADQAQTHAFITTAKNASITEPVMSCPMQTCGWPLVQPL